MSRDNACAEMIRKVARMVDFVLSLIRSVNEHIARLCDNLESLPTEFTTLDLAEVINDMMDSMKASVGLITKMMPSSERCDKEKYREFWDLHSALIFYHYDALMLLRHSLLSAFTGYYNVAFTELRNAMESVVRGVIFDLLAIPEYRRKAKELQKIKGFEITKEKAKREEAKSFPELLDLLEKKLGNKRLKVSAEFFDIIDNELEKFNPRATFRKLLEQLKEWGVINDDTATDIDSYYAKLSQLVHRVHPKSSEVGMRAIAQKDWLDLEPVPDRLFIYLCDFTDLNGLFTYLVLKVFSIDLVNEEFRRCIDWSELKQDIRLASKLAENYVFLEESGADIKTGEESIIYGVRLHAEKRRFTA